ncbi:MAG: hypothetical protein AABX29_04085 [Nanoarchaeota archaeon]
MKNNIKEEDLIEEVKFEIDKNAFKGPFICCNNETRRINKRISINGIDFNYEVWKCFKCKKEFLDTKQAQRLEKIWMIEKILNEKLISIERNVNYDGKTFFVRFPMEITKRWHKGAHANITLLSPEEFFIKIKA